MRILIVTFEKLTKLIKIVFFYPYNGSWELFFGGITPIFGTPMSFDHAKVMHVMKLHIDEYFKSYWRKTDEKCQKLTPRPFLKLNFHTLIDISGGSSIVRWTRKGKLSMRVEKSVTSAWPLDIKFFIEKIFFLFFFLFFFQKRFFWKIEKKNPRDDVFSEFILLS